MTVSLYDNSMDAQAAKPTVHYMVRVLPIEVGCNATIAGVLDHYNQDNVNAVHAFDPSYIVTTSRVASYDEATGDFETQNTRYVKVELPAYSEC